MRRSWISVPASMCFSLLARPNRTALLLTLVCTLFIATTLVWLYLDRTPPTWDDAGYLTNSLMAYDALTHGGVAGYLNKLGEMFKYRAPLIAVLPTPFYLALGRH